MFKDFLGLGKITFDLEKHKVFCIKINSKWTIRK